MSYVTYADDMFPLQRTGTHLVKTKMKGKPLLAKYGKTWWLFWPNKARVLDTAGHGSKASNRNLILILGFLEAESANR
jgi:hypothetical protein